MEELNQTELKIIEAAEKVFYQKGKEGTSMQDIADEAEITRTSLNYYYRSKDKLFEAVFKNALGRFVPQITELMGSDESMVNVMPRLVGMIIDGMLENPKIPIFVLQEMTSNPDRMPQMMRELGINPAEVMQKLKEDPSFSKLPIDPRQLIMNYLSLCIFPFAAKPVILNFFFEGDTDAYNLAMQQRKVIIPMMFEQMLKQFLS